MFDHVTIRVTSRAASEDFYNAVLRTLGIDESYRTNTFSEWDNFSLAAASVDNPPTRRLHVGFVAPSRDQVDRFWQVGTEAGYRDDGPPGPRPQYSADYYGAFLLDPDGNSAEAVHDRRRGRGGVIDHLWIRVASVADAKAFYETIAPYAGLRIGADTPDRVQFLGAAASFSLVARDADRASPHGVSQRGQRGRAIGSTRPPSPPATPTTGRPASVPATTRATTPPRVRPRREQHRGRQPQPQLAVA